MEKSVYNQKVWEMLSDPTMYEISNSDPSLKLQNDCTDFVQEMFKKNCFDFSLKNYIDHNSLSPKFYGPPKFHKANFPLRPVVSFVRSLSYGLSVTLASVLKSIKNNILNILSSKHIINDLKFVTIDNNEIMVFFDIISM